MDNEYPTEEELEQISKWPYQDAHGAFMFMKELWHIPEWGWEERRSKDKICMSISTGGWSGNEDLIEALAKNTMVWVLTWVSSKRGGHYKFEISDADDDKGVSEGFKVRMIVGPEKSQVKVIVALRDWVGIEDARRLVSEAFLSERPIEVRSFASSEEAEALAKILEDAGAESYVEGPATDEEEEDICPYCGRGEAPH